MNYRRGAYLERKLKKQLEEEGHYVMRSAGSKGPADLIAISDKEVRVIQLKSKQNGKVTPAVRRKAIQKMMPLSPLPVVHELVVAHKVKGAWTFDFHKIDFEDSDE